MCQKQTRASDKNFGWTYNKVFSENFGQRQLFSNLWDIALRSMFSVNNGDFIRNGRIIQFKPESFEPNQTNHFN